jgi:hypothetical protein
VKRKFRFNFFLGSFFLLVALILCLVPVEETRFTDPCGSIFFPHKGFHTVSEKGEVKMKVTPPCEDEHEDRLLWVIVTAGLGSSVLVFSWVSDRRRLSANV